MKKVLPVIIVVAVLVVGGLLFVKKGKQPSVPGEVGPEAPFPKEQGFTGRLKDAIAQGVPMKCTWKQNGFSGSGYVKGNKYYGEVAIEGKQGYIIMKDNCMWTWSKDENQGVKMCFEPTEEGSIWEMPREGVPDVDHTCVPAVVSDSKFNLPANVNFMDMGEMMGIGE